MSGGDGVKKGFPDAWFSDGLGDMGIFDLLGFGTKS